MEQYFLKQVDKRNCGVAVTKMMLAIFHRNLNFLRLKTQDNLGDFLKIKQFCLSYNLELQGHHDADLSFLKSTKGPMIVQTRLEGKTHFIIVKKKRHKYFVNDPGFGSYRTTLSQLSKELTGYYLSIKNHKNKGYQLSRDQLVTIPVKKAPLVAFVICHIFSLLLLFTSFILFGQNDLIHYSIILAASSFVFYVFSRQSLFILNSDYESITNPILLKVSGNKFVDIFRHIHLLKREILVPFTTVFTTIVNIVVMITMLAINDYKMLIISIVICILAMIRRAINWRTQNEYRYFDQLIERTSQMNDRKESLHTINDKTQRFIQKEFIMDIIENALIFFLVYIVMLFNHLSSLNYLLLYFFVLLYLKSNINVIINWRKHISDYHNTLNNLDTIANKL